MSVFPYDFTDEAVRHMIEWNHEPTEVHGGSPVRVMYVRCLRCRQDWPCQPIAALRAYAAAEAAS
jgi:hypothetical protein